MISRVMWLAAGAAAGAYATVKGRHAAERLSAPGLVDQAAALGTGWREFRAEMNAGMAAREHELKNQLGHGGHSRPALESDTSTDEGSPC